MVTVLPISSPFRAFSAFGDSFGDNFKGFRHHFVTIEKNGHNGQFSHLCPLSWTCFPCLGSARTDTNGSFVFCVRNFSWFSWLRRLKLRTQKAICWFVSAPVLFDTLDNQAKHIKMAKLKFGMLFSVPEVTLERVKSIPILQNSVLVCPEANKST